MLLRTISFYGRHKPPHIEAFEQGYGGLSATMGAARSRYLILAMLLLLHLVMTSSAQKTNATAAPWSEPRSSSSPASPTGYEIRAPPREDYFRRSPSRPDSCECLLSGCHLFYRAVHMRCTRDSNLVKGVNEIHHRFLIPEVIYRCHIGLQSLKMHFFSCF